MDWIEDEIQAELAKESPLKQSNTKKNVKFNNIIEEPKPLID